MLGLLKRHEVETLLKAGHKRSEIARVTGISYNSVKRIAGEPTVKHLDDTAERRARRIGRPSNSEGFRNAIKHILGTDPIWRARCWVCVGLTSCGSGPK